MKTLCRLSLLFFLTFVYLIGKSDTPYSKKFLITGINEQYAGNDELQNEFKKVTKEIMNLWDSIALINETIVIDTLGQHDQQTNRYVAHFTVTQVYDEIIKKEHYRYLVEMENVNTGERFRELGASFSPESNSFPPSKEIIKIYFM